MASPSVLIRVLKSSKTKTPFAEQGYTYQQIFVAGKKKQSIDEAITNVLAIRAALFKVEYICVHTCINSDIHVFVIVHVCDSYMCQHIQTRLIRRPWHMVEITSE